MTYSTQPRRDGFTLFELLVSTALVLVLLGGVWTLFDIFTAMETRGRRDTARARLTRGLYTQLRDDISQATHRTPINGSKSAGAVTFATNINQDQKKKEKPPEEVDIENAISALGEDATDQVPLGDAPADDSNENPDQPVDEEPEVDINQPTIAAETFAPEEQGATGSTPPEYAVLIGSRSWMILDIPIQRGDEKKSPQPLQQNSSGGEFAASASENWVASPTRHRVIYDFVAPEDLLAEDSLTVGLTRWQIDWQAASINTLTSELNAGEFGATKSIIWQRPRDSGAGSSLSFITANVPQIEREEIPELRRIMFRYYDSSDGWLNAWNSVARGGLPLAVQMRVLWNDVRTPVGDDAPVDRLGRPVVDSFSAQDAEEEMELLAEWDADNESTYGFETTTTLTPPPPGYAEYLFEIPSTLRPVRSQIGLSYGGIQ